MIKCESCDEIIEDEEYVPEKIEFNLCDCCQIKILKKGFVAVKVEDLEKLNEDCRLSSNRDRSYNIIDTFTNKYLSEVK